MKKSMHIKTNTSFKMGDFVFLYLIICLLVIVLLLVPSNDWFRSLHNYLYNYMHKSNE